MTTPTICIEPANPNDIRPDELSGFVDRLRVALPDYQVEGLAGNAMPREMRGVTWWQIVNVYLPEAAGSWVVGKVLEAGYQWAKERFRRKIPSGGRDRRPKYVRVMSTDGTEIDSMVLKSARHKPVTKEEASTPQPVAKPRRKKPKTAKGKKKRKREKGGG
jgi:hypothetical protein